MRQKVIRQFFYYEMELLYYKMRQLLQNGTCITKYVGKNNVFHACLYNSILKVTVFSGLFLGFFLENAA